MKLYCYSRDASTLIYRYVHEFRARRRTGKKLTIDLLKFAYMTLVALVVGASLLSDTDGFLKGLYLLSGVCFYWFSLVGHWGGALSTRAWGVVDIHELWYIMLPRSIVQFAISLAIMMPASLELLEYELAQPATGRDAAEIIVAILICSTVRLAVSALLTRVNVEMRRGGVALTRAQLLLREIFRM